LSTPFHFLTTVVLLCLVTTKEIAEQYNNGVHVFWDECGIKSVSEVFGIDWKGNDNPLKIISEQLSGTLFWVAFQPQESYGDPFKKMISLTGTGLG
jgi:hypothetical protein